MSPAKLSWDTITASASWDATQYLEEVKQGDMATFNQNSPALTLDFPSAGIHCLVEIKPVSVVKKKKKKEIIWMKTTKNFFYKKYSEERHAIDIKNIILSCNK